MESWGGGGGPHITALQLPLFLSLMEKGNFFIFPVMLSADLPAHIAPPQFKCHNRVKNHLSYTGITPPYKNIFISE